MRAQAQSRATMDQLEGFLIQAEQLWESVKVKEQSPIVTDTGCPPAPSPPKNRPLQSASLTGIEQT
ncbi:MAG: hypothetical protein COU66_00205 [Candidatus Pacebacteria bacterium CG10_big_fil_rev_8_21_14_0_10_44_11]|nr:MAG: hypothetical protein COU66_00205 [Candidatus Pacebacteria bacterium CG10_big_fil_rev_8_21_14_0_10_44_11]